MAATNKTQGQTPPAPDPRFVRRLCLLCCHTARNIAYYRTGYVSEDGTGPLKHRTQFGATVNSNMLDIAVLEWCKLFADHRNGHHHWTRFVRDAEAQRQFLGVILTRNQISRDTWQRYLDSMRVYRDKFVAHLDQGNVMDIPQLSIALECVLILYAHIHAHAPAHVFDTPHLMALPHDLDAYYNACRQEARDAYT